MDINQRNKMELDRFIREGDKALMHLFTNRIKESFLRDVRRRVYQTHPDFITLFDFNITHETIITGNSDRNFDYELCRHIVGIHRSNMIGKTQEQRVASEKNDSYRQEVAEKAYQQLRLRNYSAVFFRNRPIIAGDEFMFFPVLYRLFALCIKGEEIVSSWHNEYSNFFVNIFNKSLAALSMIEDNFMDSAYPIVRGVIELYIKLVCLIDFPEALAKHNRLVNYEYLKTANNGENPIEFEEEFNNRTNKKEKNQIDYLHYGWVDDVKYYHEIIKQKPYTFTSLFDYLIEIVPEDGKSVFEFLPVLYGRCHGFAHGNLGNSGYPLLHYLDLSMALYMVLTHTFKMLCTESKNDGLINGIDILSLLEEDGEQLIHQYNRKSSEMFETFYKPKG